MGTAVNPPMMNPNREIAVVAPEQMLGAFVVLIQSAPHLHLLASANSLDALDVLLNGKHPDAILVYLVQECEINDGKAAAEKLNQLKTSWREATRIAVVKYASQQEIAVEAGADLALVEGVSAERLLLAIEGKTS
jgi:CheY-like chemotaxis protein